MLKVRPERPVSPILLDLIRLLDGVAKQLEISYFIIGATARDILLEHVHGLETTRATRDIDFAVAVSSWGEYDRLKAHLIATGHLVATPDAHRLSFGPEAGAYPLDLVPFAGVEADGQVAWPPKGEFVMNVTGYADAYRSALEIEVDTALQVKIVSLPAMVVLKILAWNDRRERDKDASDVFLILRSYHEAGQAERLYGDALDLMESYDYDIELAGAALLGRDAKRDIAQAARSQIMDLFSNERNLEKFTALMTSPHSSNQALAAGLIRAFRENMA